MNKEEKKSSLLKKIGLRIKQLRTNKGLTQEQIADQLNMSCPNYTKLEGGKINIPISRLEDLAEVFGLTTSEILSEDYKCLQNVSNQGNNYGLMGAGTVQNLQIGGQLDELEKLKQNLNLLGTAIDRIVQRLDKIEQNTKKE